MNYKYFLLLILIGILLILYMNTNLDTRNIKNNLDGGNVLKNINDKTNYFTISLKNNISLEKFLELNTKELIDTDETVTEKIIENKKRMDCRLE